MELHNGKLFWPTTYNDTEKEFNTHYDVAIIGGGMSGALCAYVLSREGLKVAIIEKRQLASGSSSANTGLLQFSNDIMLHELIDEIGEEEAVRFYKLCQEAVGHLEEVAMTLPVSPEFTRRKSIYYASSPLHLPKLKKEYKTLKEHGFPVEYWSKKDMKEHLPFSKSGALITHGDAEVNPFRFVNGIFEYLKNHNTTAFEGTEAIEVKEDGEKAIIETNKGTLTASHVVHSTGYETPPLGENIGTEINRSYAIATKPVHDLSQWHERALIWETDRPYLYLRTTVDNRIIAGGLDEDPAEAPQNMEKIEKQGKRIEKEVQKMFPGLNVEMEYAWGASFGESLDHLPYIGRHPDKNRIYYLLGYGGNGTVYSMLGSRILRDLILGRPNRDAELVKLDR
ncbi:oxidoreductase [[Bacillus] enclensis]|uniref:Glycine/D-amino acid oxidase n=1 Tax=[Bacillus] enclensis TaxID=1402860 RepID=A0A0V8H883_9BACI|nr:FAD-dependent oxidoreductase [[Bacillus] enclensis]KSU58713.1 oxidoreductase [[Bacillus] enclensis]SCC33413.1 Glycine/D-amino acid oxidase [[Bacillus] enclensis]